MGRFDVLKETIVSTPVHEKKQNSRKKDKSKNRAEKKEVIVAEKEEVIVAEKKEVIVAEKKEATLVDNKPMDSEWIKRIKYTQEEKIKRIDVNNPIYWNGPCWVGPKFTRIKKNKTCDREMYLKKINEGTASSNMIPYDKIEYSKNGEDWYNSWEDTFTPTQLQALNDYEEQITANDVTERMIEIHEINRYISNRHYKETGELDDFALAEIRAYEYEEYCKQFEEEQPIEDGEDEEYLEND
jgi:hypothetical protein